MSLSEFHGKVIITASCGIEIQRVIPYKPLLDEAIELADSKPEYCVVLQRPQAEAVLLAGRDLDVASGGPFPGRGHGSRLGLGTGQRQRANRGLGLGRAVLVN